MQTGKKVLVIKKEDMLYEKPGTIDIVNAWYRYAIPHGLNSPFSFTAYELKSKRKEFKRTWHVTIKFVKRGQKNED